MTKDELDGMVTEFDSMIRESINQTIDLLVDRMKAEGGPGIVGAIDELYDKMCNIENYIRNNLQHGCEGCVHRPKGINLNTDSCFTCTRALPYGNDNYRMEDSQ